MLSEEAAQAQTLCGKEGKIMTSKNLIRKLSTIIFLFTILVSCETNNENDHEDFLTLPILEVDSLDLNSDEKMDFAFRIVEITSTEMTYHEQSTIIEIVPLNESYIGCLEPNCTSKKLELGFSIIDSSLIWSSNRSYLAFIKWFSNEGWDEHWQGEWIDSSQGYLGVRVTSNNNFHYGWITLSIDDKTGNLTDVEFKLENDPNSMISAGVTP